MWSTLAGVLALVSLSAACAPSVTTVSGTHAPSTVCSGALIFSDDFNEFDLERWQHENTLAGGGNWEFQYYSNNRTNSFTRNGVLHIRPSLLSDQFGEGFLSHGHMNIEGGAPADRCTNPQWWGCERTGSPSNVLNPIKSARLRTVNSFSFRYGRLEVRAKMPAGDWLWPAIWLMPAFNAYGTWPASGEIDLVESRGNRNMFSNGVHIGTQEAGSTLHYGPYPELNGWDRAHWARRNSAGYDRAFHRYQLEWTPDFIRFSIDDVELGRLQPGNGGFWQHGGFGEGRNILNPWRYGSRMAPFDQKVLCALLFYASGSYQRTVGMGKNLAQTTVSSFVKEVTDALNSRSIVNEFIKFPETREERDRIKQEFHAKHGIPGVIGCIDGSHFHIFKPPQEIEHLFYCRKHYHSLNVQMFYLIMNVAVGGTNGFFPDGVSNPQPKPWWNGSPTASTDFWNARNNWLPTWFLNVNEGADASLQVDYVRVWAL